LPSGWHLTCPEAQPSDPLAAGRAPRRIGWHLQQQRRGETVVFSWLVFRLRAHRDRVNARVIGDPCTAKMMGHDAMPFGPKRMAYGGFQTIVAL